MNEINNGSPAFPSNRDMRHNSDWDYEPGMSLRDYFAANALPGLLARSWTDPVSGKVPHNVHDLWAAGAYATADAMLKIRKEGGTV